MNKYLWLQLWDGYIEETKCGYTWAGVTANNIRGLVERASRELKKPLNNELILCIDSLYRDTMNKLKDKTGVK